MQLFPAATSASGRLPSSSGFFGQGPVRIGHLSATQNQHDVYGSVILAASQLFIDDRLARLGDEALFQRLEALGEQARRVALTPDAGIWEYRGRERIHTHSAAHCWAACDRLSQIAVHLGIEGRADFWRSQADTLRQQILARAWSETKGAMVDALDGEESDASVLLLAELGLVHPQDPRFIATCEAIGKELDRKGWVMRYANDDGFGVPETAFPVCTLWYIDALAAIGRREEARARFVNLLNHRNAFGLLSEDIHPCTGHAVRKYPTDLLHGGHHHNRHESSRLHGRMPGLATHPAPNWDCDTCLVEQAVSLLG